MQLEGHRKDAPFRAHGHIRGATAQGGVSCWEAAVVSLKIFANILVSDGAQR